MATQFTANDTRLISAAWQSLKSPPEVDYEKVASIMGMTNPRSASNAMANLRKKMAAATGPMQAAPGDGATPKATPSKRGRAPKKDDIGDEESPTKKKRGGKKVAAVKEEVKQEVKEESDDENGFGDRMDEGEGDATNGAEVDEEI